MINAVRGELTYVSPSTAVIASPFIEWELVVSGQTASRLSQLDLSEKKDVKLLTYLQHREDGMTLFGFLNEEERRVFFELTKVPGIGCRQAIKILSGIRVKDLVAALDRNDVKALSSIPGLGAKTAQKIILALRDTIAELPGEETGGKIKLTMTGSKWGDLAESLSEMGYDKKKVSLVIEDLCNQYSAELGTLDVLKGEEFLFPKALSMLAR